jgi:hypothetical protein
MKGMEPGHIQPVRKPVSKEGEKPMANANRKHFGAGSQGKSDGSGAMTVLDDEKLPDNMVLSNRDKAQHSQERGLDSKAVQTEQYQDHAANRRPPEKEGE